MKSTIEQNSLVRGKQKSGKAIIKRAAHICGTALGVVIAAAVAIVAVLAITGANALGGGAIKHGLVTVVSKSMEPTIMTGAMCAIETVEIEDVQVGDVVVYWSPDREYYIIHRVIAKVFEPTGGSDSQGLASTEGHWVLTTKGDNNDRADAVGVTEDMVRARVLLTMNWVAKLKTVIYGAGNEGRHLGGSTARVIAVVAGLVVLGLLASSVREVIADRRAKQKGKGNMPRG